MSATRYVGDWEICRAVTDLGKLGLLCHNRRDGRVMAVEIAGRSGLRGDLAFHTITPEQIEEFGEAVTAETQPKLM